MDNFPIEVTRHTIKVNRNLFSLRSYDVLIEMDWFENHWYLVSCKGNTISYISEEGVRQDI